MPVPATRFFQIQQVLHAHQACAFTDTHLLELFLLRRDDEAFAELVRRHGPLVLGVCRRVLKNAHDVDDVFQATFLVLAQKADSLRRRAALSSWLHGVAYRLSLKCLSNTLRRRAKEQPYTDCAHAVLDESAQRELRAVLDEELHRLPEQQRAPVLLCYAEGKSQEEASRALGWSRGTLKRRLERGREVLRQRLTRRGLALSAAAALSQHELLAAVPPSLAASTVHLAGLFASAKPAAALGSSSAVLALARAMLKAMFVSKVKAAAATALVVGVFALGAGVVAHQTLAARTNDEQVNVAKADLAHRTDNPPVAAQTAQRTDASGDPLPKGAVLRLGSTRHRGENFVFSNDGKWLFTSQAHIVHMLDAATGRVTRRFAGQSYRVNAVAVSPDGIWLVTAETDKARIWHTPSGKEIGRLQGDFGEGCSLRFSPDGKYVAGGVESWNNQTSCLQFWEMSSDRLIWKIDRKLNQSASVAPVAFTADGKHLLTREGTGDLVLRLAATGEKLRTLTTSARPYCVAAASSASRVATVDKNGNLIRIWDLPEGKQVQQFSLGIQSTGKIALSADGKRLATYVSDEKNILLWDIASGKEIGPIAVERAVMELGFGPGGDVLAYLLWPDRCVRLVDIATGRPRLAPVGHYGQVQAVAFAPDGARLATGGTDDTLRFWDTRSAKELRQFPARQLYVCSLDYSPDGRHLLSAGYNSVELCLWDAATGAEVRRWKAHASAVRKIRFSPDGKYFASMCMPMQAQQSELSVKLWDAATGRELHRFDRLGRDPEGDLEFTPDSKTLLYTDGPATCARVTATGRELPELSSLFRSTRMLALSPDGKSMIAAAERPAGGPGIKLEPGQAALPWFALWEIHTGKERLRFERIPNERYNRVAFSPDGRILAAGGNSDTRVFLWDLRTGLSLGTLDGHSNWIMDLAFAPDGRTLASASYDTTVLLWDMTNRSSARDDQPQLSAKPIEKHWADLASPDAFQAYTAIVALEQSARQSTPFLLERLRPASATDSKTIVKLIRDLDSPQFADRDKASRALEAHGELAVPELEKALRNPPSLEVRRRVEQLLEKARGPVILPEKLRSLRAIEILEHIGTPEACAVLKTLAEGAASARVTQEARASLSRLAKRPS